MVDFNDRKNFNCLIENPNYFAVNYAQNVRADQIQIYNLMWMTREMSNHLAIV